jgi:hypothetical protein
LFTDSAFWREPRAASGEIRLPDFGAALREFKLMLGGALPENSHWGALGEIAMGVVAIFSVVSTAFVHLFCSRWAA